MVTIESTPEMAARVYETMKRNLEIVRRRLGRPLTLADKVLLGHLDDPERQEMVPGKSYLFLRPDRVVFQDVLGQTGMLQFMQTRRDHVAVPTTIHCDHLIQARREGVQDLRESLSENTEVYDFLRSAAAKFGALFAVVLLVVKLVQNYLPGEGFYVVAAVAGLTDVDAITLSMADYGKTGDADIAVTSIVIATLANTLVKAGMVATIGTVGLRNKIVAGTAAILAAGGCAVLLL